MRDDARPPQIVEIDVPADLDTTWDHLREPALVRRWYGWDGPDQDERVRQFVEAARTGGVGEARVLSWRHGRGVHVTLTPHGPATLVVVTRPPAEAEFGEAYDEVDEDWIQRRARAAVRPGRAPRPGEAHLVGPRPGRRRPPAPAAGPDRAARCARHPDRRARGHPAAGRHHGRRHAGLPYRVLRRVAAARVRAIVPRGAAQTPPRGAQHPNGEVDAVLHTYGMDDETMAQVTRRWGGWWR